MKVESYMLIGIAAFFAAICGLYWFTSYEDSGTVMLFLSAALGLLPGSYLFYWTRRMKPRPEDNRSATMEDGAGVVGAFPTSSVWPFVIGMGATFVVAGAVFGIWIAIVGLTTFLSGIIGGVAESRRGGSI